MQYIRNIAMQRERFEGSDTEKGSLYIYFLENWEKYNKYLQRQAAIHIIISRGRTKNFFENEGTFFSTAASNGLDAVKRAAQNM